MSEKVRFNDAKKLLLGTRLKECRKKSGFSQKKLADRVNQLLKNNDKKFALNEKYLSSMENGRNAISPEYAKAFSNVLKIDEGYLLDPEWKYPHGFDFGLSEIEQMKELQKEILQEIKYLNSAGLKAIRDHAAGYKKRTAPEAARHSLSKHV